MPTVVTPSEAVTKKLGRELAHELQGGEVLALEGPLGAGKTTFVKGLAKGLGVKQVITSPTFILMKVYKAKRGRIRQLVHVDCYRLPAAEFSAIGLTDYLGDPHTVVAIEWAEKLRLKGAIKLRFKHTKAAAERTVSWR
jgi:tRNA threonylcarbamoyladenosine biosynthesis protein TsaE